MEADCKVYEPLRQLQAWAQHVRGDITEEQMLHAISEEARENLEMDVLGVNPWQPEPLATATAEHSIEIRDRLVSRAREYRAAHSIPFDPLTIVSQDRANILKQYCDYGFLLRVARVLIKLCPVPYYSKADEIMRCGSHLSMETHLRPSLRRPLRMQ